MSQALTTTDNQQVDIAALEQSLSIEQRLFVEHYLGDALGDADKAVQLSGYKGSSYNSRHVQASRLLQNVTIRTLINHHVAQHGITRDKVLLRLAQIMDGTPFSQDHVDLDLIKRMSTTEANNLVTHTYEAYDRLEAIKLSMRALGMDVKTIEHTQRRPILVKHIHQNEPLPQLQEPAIDTTYRELSTTPSPNIRELSTDSSALDANGAASDGSKGE